MNFKTLKQIVGFATDFQILSGWRQELFTSFGYNFKTTYTKNKATVLILKCVAKAVSRSRPQRTTNQEIKPI